MSTDVPEDVKALAMKIVDDYGWSDDDVDLPPYIAALEDAIMADRTARSTPAETRELVEQLQADVYLIRDMFGGKVPPATAAHLDRTEEAIRILGARSTPAGVKVDGAVERIMNAFDARIGKGITPSILTGGGRRELAIIALSALTTEPQAPQAEGEVEITGHAREGASGRLRQVTIWDERYKIAVNFAPSPTPSQARKLADAEVMLAEPQAEAGERHGIYIASKVVHAHRWRILRNAGFPIVSTWIYEAEAGQSQDLADLWRRCIAEASSAEVLVFNAEPGELFKGAWIELGAALASGVPVMAVGLDKIEGLTVAKDTRIRHFSSMADVMAFLKPMANGVRFEKIGAAP